nr:pre-mRNA-processing factor 39-like isoform X1 [Leptinotarsa decemlineata]
MEENEEAGPTVRRTRSAKAAKTSPVVKPVKHKPGPLSRRTRKKVVLMEVEVSDEDEEIPQENKSTVSDADEKKVEDKLLESPDESNDSVDQKSINSPSGKKTKVSDEGEGNHDLNGNGGDSKTTNLDDSITVVFNDVEMLEEADVESNLEEKGASEESRVAEEKMNVDDEQQPESAKLSSEKKEVKVKTSLKEKAPLETPEKNKPEQSKTETSEEDYSKKKNETDEGKIKESVPKKEKTTEEGSLNEKKSETIKEKEMKHEEKAVEENKSDVKDDRINEASKTLGSEKGSVEKNETTTKIGKEESITTKEKQKVTSSKKIESEFSPVNIKSEEETTQSTNEEKKSQSATEEKKSQSATEEKPKHEVLEKNISKISEDSTEKSKKELLTEETPKEEPKTSSDKAKEEKDSEITKMEVDEVHDEKPASVGQKTCSEVNLEENKDEALKIANDTETTKPKEEEKESKKADKTIEEKQKGDPDAENISEDELPSVQAAKVPEAEEVSDEELPGPKRAELPADTEVVSEDELPSVKSDGKKEGVKRKLDATDYDPGSPTSENEAPSKKPSLEPAVEKEKEEKPAKPKKLPELDKYWKAVNDDPTDFTGWTYLLQYVDQENDMEAAREAYDAFLSHYPYCYGYWRKYADYEKRKGNKKKCEEVFERGLKAIPLSVDLWIHYLTYVKSTRTDDEEFIRSQFERSITACGLEFRSDRLWDSFIKWEAEGKRLQRVTAIYDRLLATPTQGYTSHFDNFQEHVASNPPNKVIEVDEFLALRKEVKHMLKHDVTTDTPADDGDSPPGDEDQNKVVSTDEETKSIRERIVSIRRKVHKATVNAVTARWNYEEGIKRPYFHVKPLERCQLKNWQDYLDYETEQGDRVRIIVLFERCLIACALYEEFWLKFVHYLEGLKDKEMQPKIRDVYERACTIHHLKKPNLHLQWALFEEEAENPNRAAEVLVNLEKSVPNILQIAYRRINLERRRSDYEKCCQLYEHYINNSKNKMISSNIAIKYSRFCFRVIKDITKAQEVLKSAITKDPNNPRLYLQLIDLALQKENVSQSEVLEVIDSFLDKDSTDIEQKVLFAQRKLEFVEDFGCDVQSVQLAYDQYQKVLKQGKESIKKKETKSESTAPSKKEKPTAQSSSQSSTYNYGAYGNSATQPAYPYSGSQQQGQNYYQQYGQSGDQYQYQNWQYPQGGYGGYNQWGSYGGGYGY